MPMRGKLVAAAAALGAVVVLLGLTPPRAAAQVMITGVLNVNGLVDAGQASIAATQSDIGSARDALDGNPATLYRSANINPCQITVTFNAPQNFASFRALCAGNTTRFRVEAADTMADLTAQSGSYTLMVDWVTAPNETWTGLMPAVGGGGARTARVLRLTAERIVGDDFVHIREWEISTNLTITSIAIDPASTSILTGQTRSMRAIGSTSTGATTDVTTRVNWGSLHPAIAAAETATGRVTGLSAGVATITAAIAPLSAAAQLTVISDPTDLNATYISRTPRFNFDATPNNPAVGQVVTYTAHVRSWGAAVPAAAAFEWRYDGQVVATGTLTGLTPGGEATASYSHAWEAGDHTIAFTVDPANAVSELSEVNNTRLDRTNAILAGFWVEQSMYDYFHLRQRELGIGSNSWEDWIQRQMARHNQLCAEAVWPVSPNGILDRVRVDRIVIVPDGALPLNGGLATNNPDLSDKTVDLMWGFPSAQLNSTFYANTTSTSENNPFFIERSLIHELGHARYLIDNYGFDIHNTAHVGGHNQVQILENGAPVAGTPLMPFVAFGEVLRYNTSGGVMSGPYGFRYSPHEAGALNLIAGRRARCGNYNAPCNIGIYLNDLPLRNHVQFLDSTGCEIRGAQVRVYQAAAGQGLYGKTFDNTPDLTFTTDATGRVQLPRNPFSNTGPVTHGNPVNGVVILRVAGTPAFPGSPPFVSYRFLEVADFNIQYWMGQTADAFYTITVPEARGCAADFNCSGLITVQDVFDFLAAYFARSPRADINGSGQVSVQDVFDFLSRYFAGCA